MSWNVSLSTAIPLKWTDETFKKGIRMLVKSSKLMLIETDEKGNTGLQNLVQLYSLTSGYILDLQELLLKFIVPEI